jgi:hypothetical protein
MEPTKFEAWAIIDLFGHSQIAGHVTEQVIGGETFIRVDVPAREGTGAFTKLFGKGAIYSMTISDEDTVLAFLQYLRPAPMTAFTIADILRAQKSLTEPMIEKGVGIAESFLDREDRSPGNPFDEQD